MSTGTTIRPPRKRIRLMRRRDVAGGPRRAEIAALLERGGCPVCRYLDDAADFYFHSFETENHADTATLRLLRAGRGLCPVHTRRVLERPTAGELLLPIYRFVLAGASQVSFAPSTPGALCPACEAVDRARRVALNELRCAITDHVLADDYVAAGGVCLPHLLGLLPAADASDRRLLLEVALDRLDEDVPAGLLEFVSGSDGDAPARQRLRASLPDAGTPSPGLGARPRIWERLAVPTCPSCLAHGQGERSYLSWLAAEHASSAEALAREVVSLCPTHLHDLAGLSHSAAEWAVERNREAVERDLTRLLDRSAQGAWHRGLASKVIRRRSKKALQLGPSLDAPCTACRAGSVVDQRDTMLLVTLLSEPQSERLYRDSHGLCMRHVLAVVERAPASVREVARTRLSALEREVEGSDPSAWKRVPAQLDGWTFLGGPPR